MALETLWGTISPPQNHFQHVLSRTTLLSSEKEKQKSLAQLKCQAQGWKGEGSQK